MSFADVDTDVGPPLLTGYRMLRVLGEGGMGRVYFALREGAEGFVRPVVIKRLKPTQGEESNRELRNLFVRESQTLAALQHPNIVGVLDFGVDQDGHFLVLEYVRGYDLAAWLRYRQKTGQLVPSDLAIQLVLQLLAGLDYVHTSHARAMATHPIVHGDVSATNILIDTTGCVKLTDFGIAYVLDAADGTARGYRGKVAYSPPELLSGVRGTPQIDVYAAAVVLYECLCGSTPFAAPTRDEMVRRIFSETPAAPAQLRADVSAALSALVLRCLAKDPRKRPSSAIEFATLLRACRTMEAEAAERELSALAARDFEAPDFAQAAEVLPLDELDRLTREPAAYLRDPRIWAATPFTASSIPQTTVIDAAPPLRPSRRRAVAWGGLGAALLGVALWFGLGNHDPVLFLRAGDASLNAPLPAASATTLSERLAAQILPKQALFAQCFEAKNTPIPSGGVTLHFEIGATGSVLTARLKPHEVATTEAGECVLGVARGIQFGPQPRAVNFRIGLAIHSVDTPEEP